MTELSTNATVALAAALRDAMDASEQNPEVWLDYGDMADFLAKTSLAALDVDAQQRAGVVEELPTLDPAAAAVLVGHQGESLGADVLAARRSGERREGRAHPGVESLG